MELVPSTQRNGPTGNRNRRKPRPKDVHQGAATGHTRLSSTVTGRYGGAGTRIQKGAWTNLAGSPHAQEALTFIEESDAPPPATHEEIAAALVLTLHGWTRGHTIVLHDKTGPPCARTATCRPTNASTDEAHLEWTPEREDDEHTLPREQGGREKRPRTRTDGNPENETSSPTLDHIQTIGRCPHPSGAQYPNVHGRCVRGRPATRLDQVRNRDPGGTHGATGYHTPYNMGQRSARWRHQGAGYDHSNPV